jgi:hypothetical protein
MGLLRLGISLAGAVGIVAAILSGAAIWLVLTEPVTVADMVSEGEVTPLVRELTRVLYGALLGLLRYL